MSETRNAKRVSSFDDAMFDESAIEPAATSVVVDAGVVGARGETAGCFAVPARRSRVLGRGRTAVPPTVDCLGPASATRSAMLDEGDLASVSDFAARASRHVEPCPRCGFTAEMLAIDGAVVMVLAIPSQYRDLLAGFGSLESIDDRLRYRHDAHGWSALERIAHVADVLHASAKCEVAILDGDRDRFGPVHVDAPRAGTNAAPSRVVLGSLFAAAVDLGRALSHADSVDWGGRTQEESGGVSVRGVCDDALHESHHHLGDVEVLLNEATNPAPYAHGKATNIREQRWATKKNPSVT
jgi:hypothetical protein